ncbi:MAG: SDR family NAD(P)-dependent oxidoreductase [Desulfobulbaceae bacterium]
MRGSVLILGATSAVARASAGLLARQGYGLILAGRDTDELQRLAADLRIREDARADWEYFEASDPASHPAFFARVLGRTTKLAGVLLAFGSMGDHELAVREFSEAERIIRANFTGAVSILTLCANHLLASGGGFLVALTSVAGERGRQSNYVYGAAKGGLDLFLQGLRNRCFVGKVRVITIRPGFLDTAMTYGLPGLFLVASPEYAARRIVAALGRPGDILYVPWFWRPVMLAIRLIPEFLFKRLQL